MRRLVVLYDANCAFCVRCSEWLRRQRTYLQVEVIPAQSSEIPRRFPGLERRAPAAELIAIDDGGGVYRGDAAFIMCLYALVDYRLWALRLSQPALRPLARAAVAMLSAGRLLSRSVGNTDDARLGERIRYEYRRLQAAGRAPDACALPERRQRDPAG